MSLLPADAESILSDLLGGPADHPTQKLIGYRTPAGKVLAMNRQASETRIWFEPPVPPRLDGVQLLPRPDNGTSNLDGAFRPLKAPQTLRVLIDNPSALRRFVDWYAGTETAPAPPAVPAATIDPKAFRDAFARFQALMTAKSGRPFATFGDGLIHDWESYKPRLRNHALGLLAPESWTREEIGTGAILNRAIEAIEIQDNRLDLVNNLVFWQNRFGHANRDHRLFLEAATNSRLRREIEALLYGLFRGGEDEGATFDRLAGITGRKYPLLAYVFFLHDMDRFMPIQPTGFDRAFKALGIDFSTLQQCSWENYSTYNATIDALRRHIGAVAGLKAVRLVDAHSFCWLFATLLKLEAEGAIDRTAGGKDQGTYLSGRKASIIAMRATVENTVRNANGQIVQRVVKNKELRMTSAELEAHLAELLELQNDRCALTGLAFQYHGLGGDKALLPSLDRINSAAHYERDNLQVVCQFVNFWKSDGDNEEFRRLLMLVRGVEAG